MKKCIYLDNHATTPVDPRVFEKMTPYFLEHFGNASSSTHPYGWLAEETVQTARKQVANLIGAKASEIIFTSGATESINIALIGTLLYQNEEFKKQGLNKKPHLITTVTEHKATLEVAEAMENKGFEVTLLPVRGCGQIDVNALKNSIKENTVLISVIYANNEIGTINPIKEISELAKKNNVLLHVDAAQAVGKVAIDVNDLDISMLSLSGHKIYATKGIGALYIRSNNPRVRLNPVSYGAGQERGLSPGTLNVPSIVGLGEACEIFSNNLSSEITHSMELRDLLWNLLKKEFPELILNGHPENRLCGNLNFSIPNVYPDLLMTRLSGLAVSAGSACSSAEGKGSHVLQAIKINSELLRSTLRVGIGRFTTKEEILEAFEIFKSAITRSRKTQNNNPSSSGKNVQSSGTVL